MYLVGAGPGDPGLLTVRGAEVLGRADVVVYDRLSVASLLDLAPPGAERVSVGKTPWGPSVSQDEINALLVERGKAGQDVVRLKGGDPFVFARGGEEARALLDAGVPFEVVPGITSAVAVPAYAGVPVTHRGLATSFTVVTGHEDPWAATETDWEAVARVGGTVVVLMGVATRAAIAARLQAGGLAADTPVVSVQWGTRSQQRTVRTTLAGLADAPIEAPATLVIGAVAALDLAWFERRPLFGRRVVVTRAREQASALVARLHALGAEVVELPTIEVVEPADGGAALRDAAARVASYDWVVFTSANAVERFTAALHDARAFGTARVAVVGAATADALRRFGVVADLVPDRFVAEGLVDAFPAAPAPAPPRAPAPSDPAMPGTADVPAAGAVTATFGGGRVLLPQAAVVRDALVGGLRAKGWTVDVVEAYRTEPVPPAPEAVDAACAADAVTFTSSSTVRYFVEAVGTDAVPPVVACIGPITAETAAGYGLRVDVVAEPSTVEGLVDALVTVLGT